MQACWTVSLALLQKKCGSNSTEKEFRRLVSVIVAHDERFDHMPDYSVRMADDMITFRRRATMRCGRETAADGAQLPLPMIDPETFAKARAAAPGYDVHALYGEWQAFSAKQGTPVKHPDKAFIGFCRARHKRAPLR